MGCVETNVPDNKTTSARLEMFMCVSPKSKSIWAAMVCLNVNMFFYVAIMLQAMGALWCNRVMAGPISMDTLPHLRSFLGKETPTESEATAVKRRSWKEQSAETPAVKRRPCWKNKVLPII